MMNSVRDNVEIEYNEAARRWEGQVDQQLAVAEYRLRGNAMFFIHTEAPPALEGQGIASQLVRAALSSQIFDYEAAASMGCQS